MEAIVNSYFSGSAIPMAYLKQLMRQKWWGWMGAGVGRYFNKVRPCKDFA